MTGSMRIAKTRESNVLTISATNYRDVFATTGDKKEK
jgi:hypothetical protein